MKNPSKSLENVEIEKLQALSETVGDFIRYWGFRRIHGEIWTQVFLSKESLSGAELTQRLGVSKALVSPALTELEEYGLIRMEEDGKKTKRYSASPDVIPVIKNILKNREAKLISEADTRFKALIKTHEKRGPEDSILKSDRLTELNEMLTLAQFAIQFILQQSDPETVADWAEEAAKARS